MIRILFVLYIIVCQKLSLMADATAVKHDVPTRLGAITDRAITMWVGVWVCNLHAENIMRQLLYTYTTSSCTEHLRKMTLGLYG